MEIKRITESNMEVLAIVGRLDGTSAAQLDSELNGLTNAGVHDITLDMSALQYLSSAGLRVLLSAHKRCAKHSGQLVVTGVNKIVQEIFDVTGFAAILQIE